MASMNFGYLCQSKPRAKERMFWVTVKGKKTRRVVAVKSKVHGLPTRSAVTTPGDSSELSQVRKDNTVFDILGYTDLRPMKVPSNPVIDVRPLSQSRGE